MLESSIKRLARQGAESLKPAKRISQAATRSGGALVKNESKLVIQDTLKTSVRQEVAAAERVMTRAERAVLKNPTLRNKVTLHVAAEDSQRALIESIKTAKSSFYIETFIWHNDASGNEVIAALAERVKRAKAEGKPFDAKVLIDWFGLRQGTGGASDAAIVDKLRTAGVEVLEFSRGYLDEAKLIPITHRKLHIKDNESFITGGRNLGDEYLKASFTNPKGKVEPQWHDLMYTVEGDETGRITEEFFKNWKRAGGTVPAKLPAAVPHPTGRARVESFVTNPHTKVYTLQKSHLDLIANAEKEIVVMYPYLSDDKLVAALREAKRKNPKLSLKVILPANKEASAEGGIYSLLNKENARQLMKDGAEVRMFSGGKLKGQEVERFSHFKGMAIDGEVITIGSANGDARTFRKNHELNTVIADSATAKDFIAQVIAPDWAAARPLTKADLAADSVWVRFKQRALELVDFLF